jgi:hypothetical protein
MNVILEYNQYLNKWRFGSDPQTDVSGWVVISENCDQKLASDFSQFMTTDLGYVPSSSENVILLLKVFREGKLDREERDKTEAFLHKLEGS